MFPRSTGKLDDTPPSHLMRNVCAWTAIAVLLVAGHLTWKNPQPRPDSHRTASPTSTDNERAVTDVASGRHKTSQTLRR